MNNNPEIEPDDDDNDVGGEWKAICTEGDGYLNDDWVDYDTAVATKEQHALDTGHSTDLIQNE